MPVGKVLDLAVISTQIAAFHDPGIKSTGHIECTGVNELLEPFMGHFIRLWEQKGEGSEGFVDEAPGLGWEDGTICC